MNLFIFYIISLNRDLKPKMALKPQFEISSRSFLRKRAPLNCQFFTQQDQSFDYQSDTSVYSVASSNFLSVDLRPPESSFRSSQKKSLDFSNSSKKLARLKKLKKLSSDQCAICLQQIRNQCQLKCRHKYCRDCLLQWLQNSSKCPYCRSESDFYFHEGEKYKIEKKAFEHVQNQVDLFDWCCYRCTNTREGDIVIICDRCQMRACHPDCDEQLRGQDLREDELWYCHYCRG